MYKYENIPNWSELRNRYLAFWDRQLLDDRSIVQIQNPNPSASDETLLLSRLLGNARNQAELLLKLQKQRKSQWNWHADLFDYCIPGNLGPMGFLAFCGGEPEYGNGTVWYEPFIDSLDEADKIHFDQDNRHWRVFLELLDELAGQCAEKQQISIPIDGSPLDWIASALGTEKFLFAIIEEPEKLHSLALRLAEEYLEAYDCFYPIITSRNDGICNWMPIWSENSMISFQDDLAINISPETYEDIFLPALRKIAGHSEHSILHWHDGARQHIDWIVKAKEIDVVQWGHDPSSPPFREALSDMCKIQESGKKLFISCVDAVDAEFFISRLDPRGLMMIINTANDRESKVMQAKIHEWTLLRQSEL
jgi:hypothetical protein